MNASDKAGGPTARFVSPGQNRALLCRLCPRQCLIPPGSFGKCGVRENKGGRMDIPLSGFITALGMDPIEKKPLYHFRPGSSILSMGFAGCNLHCPFCQNWRISQIENQSSLSSGRHLSPEDVLAIVKERKLTQIAYTYSEPLIHIEYLLECMALCRGEGIANVLVSNGCINPEPAAEILALTDAANIDLKCFSEETYEKVLGGKLGTALNFIETAHAAGVHLEITTLIVPGLNDSDAETWLCAEFIAGLSREIPWHLSAYHRDYHWDAPPTSPASLAKIARMGREQLSYVYTGNIAGETNDTPCPHCGAILVSRRGYSIDRNGLTQKQAEGKQVYCCTTCGEKAPISGNSRVKNRKGTEVE
ncbi:AmmeMemoRadiSam system radical SAM enzyme [Treponema primitia]|uniref:AmmeMemoRadiSam system radical SAM enzyme n=1 Tax=Treponema primitia TaxID=88058 RepID=UPI00397EACF7